MMLLMARLILMRVQADHFNLICTQIEAPRRDLLWFILRPAGQQLTVFGAEFGLSEQIGPSGQGAAQPLSPPPLSNAGMVTAQQYRRHGLVLPLLRPGEMGAVQQPI
jgi:hypothetical protein